VDGGVDRKKPMANLNDPRKSVGHRLAIIEGHLRKVKAMVEAGDDCIDVIHQSRAIQQALRKFDEQMLAQHLRICVARDLKNGKGDTITHDLIDIFGRV
jgi:DNA-binding FrmR family transcriptional regulator